MTLPLILDRDINSHYKEFLEPITLVKKSSSEIDPYTKRAVRWTYLSLTIEVSWSDHLTKEINIDSFGNAPLGFQTAGDARCIYEGLENLYDYLTGDVTVTRLSNGVKYSIESLTRPRDNRYIFVLKKQM
jgi:hypothetical protein